MDKLWRESRGQKPGIQKLAENILVWITCTRRPLTILELQHVLAVEPNTRELDQRNLPEIDDMVSTCAGLVTVDEQSRVVRLVHYTAPEYFDRTWESW